MHKRKANPSSQDKSKRQRNASTPLNPKNADGLSQCFQTVSAQLYVSIAPSFTQDAIQGITTQHLDPLLMSYFPQAGGVVLSHSNLKLLGQDRTDGEGLKMAKIMYDSPFAYLWVSAKLLVWKPVVGDVVEGWINQSSPSHMGLLVHSVFNATIRRDAIPSNWTFEAFNDQDVDDQANKSMGIWRDEHGNQVDGKLRFTITTINSGGKSVWMVGSLTNKVRDLTQYEEFEPTQKHQHTRFSPAPATSTPANDNREDDVVKYDDGSDSSDSD